MELTRGERTTWMGSARRKAGRARSARVGIEPSRFARGAIRKRADDTNRRPPGQQPRSATRMRAADHARRLL